MIYGAPRTRNTDFLNEVQAYLLKTNDDEFFVLTSSNHYTGKFKNLSDLFQSVLNGEVYEEYFTENVLRGFKINVKNPDISPIIDEQLKPERDMHTLIHQFRVSEFMNAMKSIYPEIFV